MLQRIFDNRNPFWRFMGMIFDVALINILWLITSLPVLLVGASTAAMYDSVFQLLRGECSSVPRSFFRALRGNLKHGSLLFLICYALSAVFAFDLFYFAYSQNYLNGVMQIVVCVVFTLLLFFSLIVAIYSFSLRALFENTLLGYLKNAGILALSHPVRTLLLLLANGGYFAAALLSLYYFPAFSILFMLFGVGLPVFLDGMILMPVLQKYLPPEPQETE